MKRISAIIVFCLVISFITVFCVKSNNTNLFADGNESSTPLTKQLIDTESIFEEIELNTKNHLQANNINYSAVDIVDKVLKIELISNGTNYSTVDDVKSLMLLHELTRGNNTYKDVSNIETTIKNGKGEMLAYQFSKCFNHEEGILKTKNVLETTVKNSGEINSTIFEIIEKNLDENVYNLSNKSVGNEAFVTAGNKLEIKLNQKYSNLSEYYDMEKLYYKFAEFYDETGLYPLIEITLLDENDNIVLFITADYEYGVYKSWISPCLEHEFLETHGPKS